MTDSESLKIGSVIYRIPKKFEDFKPTIMQEWTSVNIPKDSSGICGIIYGKRGVGKTVALKDFVYQNRKSWNKVYLFSQTAYLQSGVYDFIPEDNQFDGFDVGALTKIIADQAEDVEHKIKNNDQDKIKHLLFLFDDVISDEKIRHSAAFNQLFTMGRHLRCSAIVLTQSVGGRDGISKVVRDNVDFVISFFPYNEIDRDAIVERYLSLQHKRIGDMIIKDLTTQEFTCVVIVVRKPASRMYEDYVYKWKANIKVPKFMIGTKSASGIDKVAPFGSMKLIKIRGKFRIPSESQSQEGIEHLVL